MNKLIKYINTKGGSLSDWTLSHLPFKDTDKYFRMLYRYKEDGSMERLVLGFSNQKYELGISLQTLSNAKCAADNSDFIEEEVLMYAAHRAIICHFDYNFYVSLTNSKTISQKQAIRFKNLNTRINKLLENDFTLTKM